MFASEIGIIVAGVLVVALLLWQGSRGTLRRP